jgi:hypothetical protein
MIDCLSMGAENRKHLLNIWVLLVKSLGAPLSFRATFTQQQQQQEEELL